MYKNWKIIILSFFFCVLQGQGNYEVTSPALNIREDADKTSKVIGVLSEKQIVQIENINGNWGAITFVDEAGQERRGYASMKFLQPVLDKPIKQSQNMANKSGSIIGQMMAIGIFLGLIPYIISLIETKKGKMVTIVNWYDFILLCLSFLFIALGETYILGIIFFVGSSIWSCWKNIKNGSILYGFVSIGAKLFLVSVAALLLGLILLYIFLSAKRTTKRVKSARGHYYEKPLTIYEMQIEEQRYRSRNRLLQKITDFIVLDLIASINGVELIKRNTYE